MILFAVRKARWTSAVALLGVVGSLVGAEFVVRDAQIEVGALPTGFDYRARSNGTEVSGTDAFASGTSLRGGVRWSWAPPGSSLGALAGADLLTDGFTYAGGGGMAEVGARVAVGGGWAINDSWQLAGEVGYGYGLATFNLDQSTTIPATAFSGPVATYDGRFIGTYQAWRHLQLMLSVGWQHAEYQLSADGVDLELQRSGPTVGLGVTWRIDDAPPQVR